MPPAASDDILLHLRAKLGADADWRRFVGAGEAWVCPRCRRTVEAAAPTRPALLRAMRDHLADDCAPAPLGDEDALADAHRLAIVRHRLLHDAAWGVRRGDAWRCPACLEAVALDTLPGVDDGQRVVAHLGGCEAWRRGTLHAAAEVAEAEARATPQPARPAAAEAAVEAPVDERGRDLERARAVQLRLMREPPAIEGFRFATRYESCTEISGDFNQFIPLPDGRVGIAQGDVSGHGVQAGLIMAMANKILELYAHQGLGPKETLVKVNDALAQDLGGRMFVTMSYAVLDPGRRELRWVRAGHNQTLLRSRGQATRQLLPKGMMVGTPNGALFAQVLAEEVTPLTAGDVLLLFTDGLTEAMDPDDQEFGLERMVAVLDAHADAGAEAVVAQLFTAVHAFRRGRPMADDASVIVVAVG